MALKARSWLSNYEAKSELPLFALSLVYLALYSGEVLLPSSSSWTEICRLSGQILYGAFAADFVLRVTNFFATSKENRNVTAFLKSNVLTIIALVAPMLRALRVLRVLMVLRGFAAISKRRSSRAVALIITSFPILVYVGSLAILDAEKGQTGSNISNFADALWWSIITMTTVGYGDHYPVTLEGRFVAIGLLLAGIALISALTGLVANWLLRGHEEDEAPQTKA